MELKNISCMREVGSQLNIPKELSRNINIIIFLTGFNKYPVTRQLRFLEHIKLTIFRLSMITIVLYIFNCNIYYYYKVKF